MLSQGCAGGRQMVRKRIADMDLAQLAASGQSFRMWQVGQGCFALIAFGKYLEVAQGGGMDGNTGEPEVYGDSLAYGEARICGKPGEYEPGELAGREFVFSCTEEEFSSTWQAYFDLGTDYGAVKQRIDPADGYLRGAVEFGAGIRILRQELWETIVVFLISQQNNIPRIRRCVELLCEHYGRRQENFRGEAYAAFPEPGALADATLEELLGCNLGYRAKYVKRVAEAVAGGEFDLQALAGMPYEDARRELMKLYGAGTKVAECICLFALHHVDAFPVDTHIEKILKRHYPQGFPLSRYEGCAGILQQYMFYYDLAGK